VLPWLETDGNICSGNKNFFSRSSRAQSLPYSCSRLRAPLINLNGFLNQGRTRRPTQKLPTKKKRRSRTTMENDDPPRRPSPALTDKADGTLNNTAVTTNPDATRTTAIPLRDTATQQEKSTNEKLTLPIVLSKSPSHASLFYPLANANPKDYIRFNIPTKSWTEVVSGKSSIAIVVKRSTWSIFV
jgi:hypothetical protein